MYVQQRAADTPDAIQDFLTTIAGYLATLPPIIWGAAALLGIVGWILALAWRTRRPAEGEDTPRPRTAPEDLLTRIAAGIATGMSAQGMWRFASDILHLDGTLRLLLFAFIEIAVVTSAIRARRNMQASAARAAENPWERPSAGIDGTAVWVLTCLTAVLSSMDARSPGEFVFRLAAPLVAAWLWERGMAIERTRITGRARINWRLTPERILVRLGLAEASDRTASDVDAHRKLTRVARAAKRARTLEQAGARAWRQRRALVRLDRALDRAVEHSGLASDPDRQRQMLDQIGAMYSAGDLRHLPAVPPWAALDHPLMTTQQPGTRPGSPEVDDELAQGRKVPGVPADLAGLTLTWGPVPDDLYPVAADRYAAELGESRVPGVKKIKDDMNVGQDRAVRIQGYLKALAPIWPRTLRSDAPEVPRVMFREPVNGAPAPTDIPLTEVTS
jgi:hypothetical protein